MTRFTQKWLSNIGWGKNRKGFLVYVKQQEEAQTKALLEARQSEKDFFALLCKAIENEGDG